MKRAAVLLVSLAASAAGQQVGFWEGIRASLKDYLGRPYSWGSAGQKSFDCSGYVWRVFADNGVLLNRTTARKYYFSLPRVEEGRQSEFGNIVFFDNLKHCGVVNSRDDFYHAQTSRGTNLSPFNQFWRGKVCGYRRVKASAGR